MREVSVRVKGRRGSEGGEGSEGDGRGWRSEGGGVLR